MIRLVSSVAVLVAAPVYAMNGDGNGDKEPMQQAGETSGTDKTDEHSADHPTIGASGLAGDGKEFDATQEQKANWEALDNQPTSSVADAHMVLGRSGLCARLRNLVDLLRRGHQQTSRRAKSATPPEWVERAQTRSPPAPHYAPRLLVYTTRCLRHAVPCWLRARRRFLGALGRSPWKRGVSPIVRLQEKVLPAERNPFPTF